MLVAAAGLAGAGKTTACNFLATIGAGSYYYVGGLVRDEVAKRGLAPCPENERVVRESIRQAEGMAALAKRAAPELGRRLNGGETVLIDAICNIEEANFYRATFGQALTILAVETSFEARVARLAERPGRPLSATQLIERDRYETDDLAIQHVIASASVRIENTGDRTAFEAALIDFAARLS